MANTNTISRTAQYVIVKAFQRLKKIRPGDTMEGEEMADALLTLQDMMRGWENGDSPTFKRQALSVPLVAGKGMYELNTLARVRDVHHARISLNTGFEIPLTVMNGREFLDMPAKDTTRGMPSQYWFDRSPSSHLPSEPATDQSADAAKIYLWTKPDASTVAQGGTLQLRVSVPYLVPGALSDELDVPEEWFEAVTYLLAAELFAEYGGNENVLWKAQEKWQAVKDSDRPSFIDVVVSYRG